MSHYYHAETIAVLRLIGQQRDISSRALSDALGITRDVAKAKIDNLRFKGLVESHRETRGGPAGYFITPNGERLLKKIDGPADMGEFPAPREAVSRDPYIPQPWAIREGGSNHESIKSRRGDEFVEHRPVLCLGAMPIARALG